MAMGVIATVDQWVGVKTLRLGEASVIGNMEYSKLTHAAIFGYALFSEIPDFYTLV
ncbi:MAG: hypothetical protein V7723_00420 [Sneathiella sp.]|uniref:hypothetical protein n=1 Tax=Sneathiella sp. TaxID=1964365 RepID=UPI0030027B15